MQRQQNQDGQFITFQQVETAGYQFELRGQAVGRGCTEFNLATASDNIPDASGNTDEVRNLSIIKMQCSTAETGKSLAQLVKNKGITKLRLYDCTLSHDAARAFSEELLIGSHQLFCLELDGSAVTHKDLLQYVKANSNSPFTVVRVLCNENGDEDISEYHKTHFIDKLSWFAAKKIVEMGDINSDKLPAEAKDTVNECRDYLEQVKKYQSSC